MKIYTTYETDTEAAVLKLKNDTGRYWLPTDTLQAKAVATFTETSDTLRKIFEAAKISDETTAAIITDYARALFGVFDFTATREQMAEAVAKLSPPVTFGKLAYNNPHAFLFAVFTFGYGVILDEAKKYEELKRTATETDASFKDIVDETETDEQKRIEQAEKRRQIVEKENTIYRAAKLAGYIRNGATTPKTAFAASFLLKWGEFADAYEVFVKTNIVRSTQLEQFFNDCQSTNITTGFLKYYTIAKYTLQATADELQALKAPKGVFVRYVRHDIDLQIVDETEKIAGVYADDINATITRIQKLAADNKSEPGDESEPIEKSTKEKLPKRKGKNKNYEKVDARAMASLIGRGLDIVPNYKGKDGAKLKGAQIVPFKIVDDVSDIDEVYIQRPLTALIMMAQGKKAVNGKIELETTITDICRYSGIGETDTNAREKINRVIKTLDGLFGVVYSQRGAYAYRLFTLQKIGLTGEYQNRLLFELSAEVFAHSRPVLISKEAAELLKATAGVQKARYYAQLLGKDNMNADEMLNQIFGYETRLKIAELSGDAAELERVRNAIKEHKRKDKAKLLKWFDADMEKGNLKNFNGGEGGVYKWKINPNFAKTITEKQPKND